ncbi:MULTISPECIES: hypothetical protein [unclassified Paenibacillus]|uniref:hypothetical protein n=1 Tax=unclassified Paenibacillus TaxID=185978 RepID=UPI0009ADA268|nr:MULTISPECIES: hypothetical protein [unclassified Paenibacillus]MBE1444931.1 hypothetical protein [Paenibacillus sp. OAS669]
MKKIIFLLIFVLATLTACMKEEPKVNYGNASLQTHYQALEEIAYDAQLIVEVELTGESKNIRYKEADFNVIEAQVKKVIKGDEQLNSKMINVLEVAAFSLNDHKKNILFLKKYDGPVTDNAYFVAGVYQGKLNLGSNNKIVYDADKYGGVKTYQSDLEGLDAKSVEEKVAEAVKNARPPKKLNSDENQLKKNEEESRKLLEQDKKLEKVQPEQK